MDESEVFFLENQSELNGTGVPPPEDQELFKLSTTVTILLCLLYGGITLAGFIGNALVLGVIKRSRDMRTVTNMLISNLALADMIILVLVSPFQLQAALLQRWNLPEILCALCPSLQVVSVSVSVFTLLAIAVDRYRAVIFPLRIPPSREGARWTIIFIWIGGLLLTLPTGLDYRVIQVEEGGGLQKPFCTMDGLSDSFRKYYVVGLVVLQYVLPLLIIGGAYARIATKLWGTSLPGNEDRMRDALVLHRKRKTIKMLAIVVLLFALCWLPFQTYNFLQALIPTINGYRYINILWFSFHWLGMANSCVNPFIYAICNDKFKREFRSWLRGFWRHCSGGSEDPQLVSENTEGGGGTSPRIGANLVVRYSHRDGISQSSIIRIEEEAP